MNKLTKILVVLMALLMVVSAFASCNMGDDNGKASSSTPAATNPSSASKNTLEDLIPADLDLGATMNILSGYLYYDEWLFENDGDIVGTELYSRIPRVEKNLGIELNVEVISGTQNADFQAEVRKRQESTDPNMIADLVSSYSMDAGTLTLEGRYQNINNSDYINLENPWWPKDLLENSTIDDKVYFVSGDISPTLIYETYAIFFNIDLVEKYNLDNPIDLVNSMDWTLDTVIEMTSGIFQDLDGVDGASPSDFIAFNFNDGAHLKAFPFAMGVRVIEPDDDDGYVWSELYTGGKMEIITEKITNWITGNSGVTSVGETGVKDYGTSFKNGTCIFTVGNFAYASHHVAGMEVNYGVVPCPLYDDKQEEYYSYYGNPTSFWGIPTNAVDVDNSCALLESFAADAYVYVSPVLFERALKHKYVTGEVSGLSKMFDIIRYGLVFDACMFYNSQLGSTYNGFSNLDSPPFSWTKGFTAFKIKAMATSLNTTIVSQLRKLEY